nr:septum formation initiator family protein [uncultured Cellulosilyticum sp.]
MRQKKLIKRITVIITVCSLMGLVVSTYNIDRLTKKVEIDITTSQDELDKNKNKLNELQKEMEDMDSIDYIERVAREQLGMVDSDTIIIREKP